MSNKEQIRNVDFLIAKQKFTERFEKLFIDLQGFSISGHFKQTIQRFRPCLQPNEALNESRLPFLNYNINSRKTDKNQCVLCILSFVIQEYWKFCNGNLNLEPGIIFLLELLERYAKNGREAYKIAGEFPKFYLKKI